MADKPQDQDQDTPATEPTAAAESQAQPQADENVAVAEADEERGEQTVTVEDVGPARKLLTIEVPGERIAAKIEESFGKLRDEAAIPGFRRGRAPQRLLQRRFGTSVRDEVRGQIISECYSQAVEDEKLDVLGEPDVKDLDDIELPESGSMTFKVEVEVSPQFELPAFEGLEVIKPTKELKDEDVSKEIENYRERFGQMKPVEGGKVEAGDYASADIRVLPGENAADDAEPLLHQPHGYVLVRGKDEDFKGHVAGIVVNDLGKQLIGKQIGDEVTINAKGPSRHEDDRIKDQPITIKLRLDGVQRLEPAKLEDLLPQFGVEDEQGLRESVRKMIESRHQREQTSAMHEQVTQWLADQVQFELPEGLTGRQTARLVRRQAMELAYQGLSQEQIEQRLAEMRQESEQEARKQLKLFFILDKAAKQLEVEVSENEVNGRVYMLAMQQGRRPEKLRQELQRSGELEYLYMQLREQKTLDQIVGKAKVTEGELPAKKDS